MKILSLPPYFSPEITAGIHLEMDLFEVLCANGYSITIHVPSPTRGVSTSERKEYKKRKHEVLLSGRLEINRFPLFEEGKKTLQRAFRYTISIIIQFLKGIDEKDVDIIILSSTPPIIGIIGALLHKVKRIPFVYIVQDIFPDSLVHTGLSHKGSLAWKIGRKIEDYTYRNADRIIVISNSFKNNLVAKQVPINKIEVIPNWIDTDQVFPISRQFNPLFSRLSLDSSLFYITYCGNIGHTQNLELLISVAENLASRKEIKFILFGDGAYLPELLTTIKNRKITNIMHFPFQPYEDIASVFSLGDVGLIISKEGISSNSVPSKTWSIMAAERPVLASFDTDSMLGEVIHSSGSGRIIPANDTEAFIAALLWFYNNPIESRDMGKRGRLYIKANLDKEICTNRYVQVVNDIIGMNKN